MFGHKTVAAAVQIDIDMCDNYICESICGLDSRDSSSRRPPVTGWAQSLHQAAAPNQLS